ncbi:MAG: family 10 glycosylhydrolase [Bacteroidaceae bacterium]|nr:family 10 glycosylhydrolase [Bacteroidaceae bacterium]
MRLLKLLFSLTALFFSSVAFAQIDYIKYEYRAVWLTVIENLDWPTTQVKSPSDIDRQKKELVVILDSLQALNVNCVMLQTRVRGDVIYPSEIEAFTKALTGVPGKNPGYDALAFAIDECHKRGMQLHAWIVALPLGKAQYVRAQGKNSLVRRKPHLCRSHKEEWFMEPGEPATADYLASLVDEIVSRYDVDGIHLDYIRYPDRPGGYADGALYRRYGNGETLADWRRANVTKVVRRVYNAVKERKPWVRVSCAPLGKHDDLLAYSSLGWNARSTVFQDAQEWMRLGIMDALFPMLYFSGNNFYPFVRDWQEQSCGRHVAPGIGAYRLLPEYGNWDVVELKRQLLTSRAAGCAGSVMFRVRHLLDDIKGFTGVYSSIYDKRALVPPIAWCSDSAPDAPQDFAGERRGDRLYLSWKAVTAADGHPAVKYNVYSSVGEPVDINNPRAMMDILLADTAFVWEGSSLQDVHWAVTAVDAYGVESVAARWCENGVARVLERDEFTFPEPCDWGMRIVLRDAAGRLLYSTPYRMSVGVRGLPPGVYMLEVVLRNGKVVERHPFSR